MKLEPIIQSEVSQKEKHQYSILTQLLVLLIITIIFFIYLCSDFYDFFPSTNFAPFLFFFF